MVLRERIELSASHHWWGLYHELIDSYISFSVLAGFCAQNLPSFADLALH
jgi:hypothetical protein